MEIAVGSYTCGPKMQRGTELKLTTGQGGLQIWRHISMDHQQRGLRNAPFFEHRDAGALALSIGESSCAPGFQQKCREEGDVNRENQVPVVWRVDQRGLHTTHGTASRVQVGDRRRKPAEDLVVRQNRDIRAEAAKLFNSMSDQWLSG